MTPCPLCHPDPDRVFLETDQVLGIWDAYPVNPGHALLVPRRHVADWFAATPTEQQALWTAIGQARNAILANHSPAGFNIGINVGEPAGQTVPHLHLHVIPRYEGDVPDPRGGVRYVIPAKGNYLQEPVGTAWPEPATTEPAKPDLADPRSSTHTPSPLTTGGLVDPFLHRLRPDLSRAQHVDIAVAFVLPSGLRLIENYLQDLIDRGGSIRFLTGDYQDVTDPDALQRLLDLEKDGQLRLRIFECSKGTSFHPKAYLLSTGPRPTETSARPAGHQMSTSVDTANTNDALPSQAHPRHEQTAPTTRTAYIGSSNLTQTALETGIEWNYRVDGAAHPKDFQEIQRSFDELFEHPATRAVTHEWIDSYRKRRRPPETTLIVPDNEPPPEVPKPHDIQEEALQKLEDTRAKGNSAGLVVLATGLGKTWLAAFDSDRPEYKRVLFVAHREEILDQALGTFRKIRPTARLGRYSGKEKSPEADVIFASVQTLSRVAHLRRFPRSTFDYIVIDEFHHAAAATYRKLLDYFEPKFLLGLTATPERTDGGDLLALCQENLVYRCDLARGIETGLLSPFHYFGVPDEVDYSNIPWRSSRFDEQELTSALATQKRAQNALDQYRDRGGERTLGFCCSTIHADFMKQYFAEQGVTAASVHSGPTSDPRAESLERLRSGELNVLFAVDFFNEGVDLPAVDTVMMLRPTESRILWLQQFGRGLRVAEGKERLTVIDYIGNHRSFLLKPQTLFDLGSGDHEVGQVLKQAAAGTLELPPGCDVTYDLKTIDILTGLLRTPKSAEALQFYYRDFRDRRGGRPTAIETFHDGYNPGSVRRVFGSWLGFVDSEEGLTSEQQRAFQANREFLEQLEITPMTRSYKMLLLLALLNEDAFPGELGIDQLVEAFVRLAQRSEHLRADVGDALNDTKALRKHLETNPIEAWCGGKGTVDKAYFEYVDGVFRSRLTAAPEERDALQEMTRELCDWRLAQYLTGKQADGGPGDGVLRCKVSHAGNRPIIFLPDRNTVPGVPSGWTPLRIDGIDYEGNFVKVAVNVVRKPGNELNELPAILRRWFGPDAGRPGTRHEVSLTQGDGFWTLTPSDGQRAHEGAEVGKSYARAEIPGLFGVPYKPNKWRTGFIKEGKHIFLLVTLDKGDMVEEHKYQDKFLSPTLFQWQSQNRMARSSKSSQELRDHEVLGYQVHLFVRKARKTSGRTTPFKYHGPVEFVRWDSDNPITVVWRILRPIDEREL